MLAVVSVCGIIFSLYKVTAILLFSVLVVFYADFNLLKNKKYVKAIVWCVILVIAFCISYIRCSRLDEQRNKYLSEITDGESVYIFGKIYKSEYKNNSYTYYLRNDSGYSMLIYSDADILSVGDIPTIKGKVKKFASATNEGEFDREKFYVSQMILFALEPHEIIDKGKTGYNYRKLIYDVKDRLFGSLNKISSAEEIRTLCTMLLGEKSVLSEETKELYQNAGISHILAISGVKTLKLDIPLVPETRINWAFVPLHIAIIYILKLCLDEEIIPRCRFPCSRGYFKKCINWQKK